jgi:proline iminopeptidase
MADLYPENKPFDSGSFDTGDGHSIYYERHGNPQGKPVVYLHGGPGAGCSFREYRLFDPSHFNILLFDQRGSGKSLPYAGIANNDIHHLVEDLDKLRQNFGYGQWSITGGSWGSALAMLYAAKYPRHIDRMLLRGIFFADRKGADYIIEEDGAAKTRRSPLFDDYRNFIPAAERRHGLKQAYYNRLISENKAAELEAATLFNLWDTSIATYIPRQDWLDDVRQKPGENLALSRIFFHFAVHEFDNQNREHLLSRMAESKIPLDIIHGRQDYICPVENAEELHRRCPGSRIQIPDQCGHSQMEQPLLVAFLKVTDRWVKEDRARVPDQNPCPAP